MASPRSAWGMEVGSYAIKAIRLERDGDRVLVTDFAVIPHKKVLTTPDLDQEEMTRLGIGQFISQKAIEGEHLVMSVPGHAAFARFAKLPPVEPKKVPDIVKFEAVQQIPFPIDQVEWDYETFTDENSPEVEVGIFAMTRDRVNQHLGLYGELGIQPESLTLSPVAVYNAVAYDQNLAGYDGPVMFLDIGTSATDLIVAERGRCWIRTFPLGGTHFTEAIANTFKISYSKAEKLKQEAATSKYFKQIMQAMRPVFSDLLQDVQRSIGYYQSLHRESELSVMIGLGSTMKIPGLRKFLGQQLQMDVLRLDEFKRIRVEGREAAEFASNAVNMATAYGLALQGVGLGSISANLVPVSSLREQIWHSKTKWFAAAAAIIVAAGGLMFFRPVTDGASMEAGGVPPVVKDVIARNNSLKGQYDDARGNANVGFKAVNMTRLLDYREIWPHLVRDAASSIASTDPQPELLGPDVEKIKAVPAGDRRFVKLENLGGNYEYIGDANSRRIRVTMDLAYSNSRDTEFINSTVCQWLRDNAEREGVPYRILTDTIEMDLSNKNKFEVKEDGSDELKEGKGRKRREREDEPSRPGRGDRETFGGSDTGMGGGGMQGRREVNEGSIQAPGSSLSTGGSGSGGNTGSDPVDDDDFGSFDPGRRTADRPSGVPEGKGDRNLEELAPIPSAPTLYEAGSVYYTMPVVFEVELLDPNAPPAPDSTAGRGLTDGDAQDKEATS